MSDIEGGGEDQSYADCSVDGDDSPRYPSPSAESMDSCSLDSSDQEETDPAGEPTPAARPESPPPVAINLVSDDEERGEDDGGDEAPQEPPVAALSPKRASHAPRLTDLPPANPKQRSRKKTASQQPPPVAISAVVSDDDGDEQLQPGGGAEEAPRQPPVAALSPKRAAYHAPRLTDLPPKLKRSREKTARHHGQHVLAARRPQLAPPVTTGIPHAHDDQQHGDDRVEETLPQPPKRVAHHVPPLTDFPPHLQRFPKAATSHHGQPMPAARLEIPPPVTTSTADREEKPGHDRAEETPQQVPVAPLPPKRSAYALRLTDLPPDLQWFMQETKSFFTRPHALERHGQMLAASTFDKALERILCYLGYVQRIRPGESPSVQDFHRGDLIEGYLDYLKEERNLSPATLSVHASSLLYPLKYCYRGLGPQFEGIRIISQLRRTATVLQKQGDLERATAVEDLKAQSKWLDWDQVLLAREAQRCRFELAKGRQQRAQEARDLLLLSLYTHLPPSRGLEIRTMELVLESQLEEPFQKAHYRDRNVALIKTDGDGIVLHLGRFKTCKQSGPETIPIQADSQLCRLFIQFVSEFRKVLNPTLCSNYLFLNSKGAPYSSTSFTTRLQKMFELLTGSKVAVCGLRSSFVTWAYSQSGCDDQMKDSLAACLRHSREQAQHTYDRRTANQKKTPALDLARRKAEEEELVAGPMTRSLQLPEISEPEIDVGDFVGLVAEDSTLQKPSIFLGRVQAFLPEGQALLLWYRHTGGSNYAPDLDGEQWVESRESLVAVKVAAAKGSPYAMRLLTSVREIHKAVMGGERGS